LEGNTTIERTSDFQTGGDYRAENVNTEQDKIFTILQEQERDIAKCVKIPPEIVDTENVDMTLPLPEAGNIIGWNEDGDGLENKGTLAELQTVSVIADEIVVVAGISSNVTIVAGIAANITTAVSISSDITAVSGNATNINAVAAAVGAGSLAIPGTSAAGAAVSFGGDTDNGADTVTITAPSSLTGNRTLTAPDRSGTIGTDSTLMAAATLAGAVSDFVIPSGVKEIKVMLSSVNPSSTDNILIQLGTSGGIVSSGYVASASTITNGASPATAGSTSGFIIKCDGSAMNGLYTLGLQKSDTGVWVFSGCGTLTASATLSNAGGLGTLSGELTTVRITTSASHYFDSGSISLSYRF
jgi:hypothetical protein